MFSGGELFIGGNAAMMEDGSVNFGPPREEHFTNLPTRAASRGGYVSVDYHHSLYVGPEASIFTRLNVTAGLSAGVAKYEILEGDFGNSTTLGSETAFTLYAPVTLQVELVGYPRIGLGGAVLRRLQYDQDTEGLSPMIDATGYVSFETGIIDGVLDMITGKPNGNGFWHRLPITLQAFLGPNTEGFGIGMAYQID